MPSLDTPGCSCSQETSFLPFLSSFACNEPQQLDLHILFVIMPPSSGCYRPESNPKPKRVVGCCLYNHHPALSFTLTSLTPSTSAVAPFAHGMVCFRLSQVPSQRVLFVSRSQICPLPKKAPAVGMHVSRSRGGSDEKVLPFDTTTEPNDGVCLRGIKASGVMRRKPRIRATNHSTAVAFDIQSCLCSFSPFFICHPELGNGPVR